MDVTSELQTKKRRTILRFVTTKINNRGPVLPEEIFRRIFDHLQDIVPSKSFDAYPLSRPASAAIATCSQVCRMFSRICKPELFKEISIQFNIHGVNRLHQLIDILDTTPSIADYVRVLKIDCTKWFSNILSVKVLLGLQRVLTQFSNLKHLSGGLQPQDFLLRNESESEATYLNFRDRLVESYAFKGRLCSLHLSALSPNTPLSDIFACSSLRKLKIWSKSGDLVPFLDLPDSNLTHLEIETDIFRFSTLCFLPHLEILKISADKCATYDAPLRYPSFKLKYICLKIESTEWVYLLLGFLQSKARNIKRQPFEALERLDIALNSANVTQNILGIIHGMSSLRWLDISASYISIKLANLRLHKLIVGYLRHLANLSITFKDMDVSESDSSEASEGFIDDLWFFLMSIFNNNVLQALSIDLEISTPTVEVPLKPLSWRRTAKMLASHAAFPALTTVFVNIQLRTSGGTWNYQKAGMLLRKLEDLIEEVFEPLRGRLGSALVCTTSVIRS